jgi:hypothetical protein
MHYPAKPLPRECRLHAYSLWAPDQVRLIAQAADLAFATGVTVGPLHGVPGCSPNGIPRQGG